MVSAEFLDIFGFMAFVIVLIVGIWMLKTKKKLPRWIAIILIIVGVLGLIIDGLIVGITYLI